MSAALSRRLMLLTAAALPGCTLIDQRTFNPDAGRPPVIPKPPPPVAVAPPEPGAPPLLTIRLPTTADLRPAVTQAVAAARARKRDVSFEVVEIAPGAGATVGAEAAEIARIITAQGVPARNVSLAVRPVPNVAREVRVYIH